MFYHKDTPEIEIFVLVETKDHMHVVGIMFDGKLTWAKHISILVRKANSALHAIKLIKKYFTQAEII